MPKRIFSKLLRFNDKTPIKDWRLSASSSSFCPVDYTLTLWITKSGQNILRSLTLKDELLFETGHIIHEIYQKWLGHIGVLYGDWKCYKCKTVSRGFKDRCSSCGFQMEYKELFYSSPFIIHPDAPVRLSPFEGPPNCVLELKSTSQENWFSIKSPYEAHITQVQACGERMMLDGFPINKLVILYLSRNRPWIMSKFFVFEPKPVLDKLVNRFNRIKEKAEKGIMERYDWDHDLCTFCRWIPVCSSSNRRKIFREIRDNYLASVK